MKETIKTERLTLCRYKESDRDRLAELLTNETIKETFMIPDYKSSAELSKAVEKLFAYSLSDEHFERGIFFNGELIGFVNDVEICNGMIELGYAIHPNFHNQGFATEMFKAVINEFLNTGYSAVIAGAFDDNAASICVMQKCGMKITDREEDIVYRGKTHRCIYYEITK